MFKFCITEMVMFHQLTGLRGLALCSFVCTDLFWSECLLFGLHFLLALSYLGWTISFACGLFVSHPQLSTLSTVGLLWLPPRWLFVFNDWERRWLNEWRWITTNKLAIKSDTTPVIECVKPLWSQRKKLKPLSFFYRKVCHLPSTEVYCDSDKRCLHLGQKLMSRTGPTSGMCMCTYEILVKALLLKICLPFVSQPKKGIILKQANTNAHSFFKLWTCIMLINNKW